MSSVQLCIWYGQLPLFLERYFYARMHSQFFFIKFFFITMHVQYTFPATLILWAIRLPSSCMTWSYQKFVSISKQLTLDQCVWWKFVNKYNWNSWELWCDSTVHIHTHRSTSGASSYFFAIIRTSSIKDLTLWSPGVTCHGVLVKLFRRYLLRRGQK